MRHFMPLSSWSGTAKPTPSTPDRRTLALAVRTGVRIFASAEVLDRAGVEPEIQVDEKLEVFREFVNSLDVNLEEGFREGPGSEGSPRE